jgi:hypothetical protein
MADSKFTASSRQQDSGFGIMPTSGQGGRVSLLVAFPVTACTSSESAVFVDEEGRFIGSVAPGTAASLVVFARSKHLFVISSLDVTETPRTWFVRHEIPRRSDQGVIVEVPRADGHNCAGKWSGPLVLRPRAATHDETVQAALGLTWLEVRADEGNRWLDDHRERVDELVGHSHLSAPPQPVITTITESR